jgi:predicted ester cyclase
MSAEDTRRVVLQMLQALDNADWAALEAHPGLYETRQNYRFNKAAAPDSRHEIVVEVLQDEWMACVAVVTGTHTGPLLGVAPTGKQIRYNVLLVDHVQDGVITEHWALPDLMSIFQQVGKPLLPGAGGERPQDASA